MKRLMVFASLVMVLGVIRVEPAFSASSVSLQVQATVPETLELVYWIRKAPPGVDPYGQGSSDASAINFGQLQWDENNNIWVATHYFTVFLIGATGGRPYEIRQTCTGVVNPDGEDINDSFILTPGYNPDDEWSPGNPQGGGSIDNPPSPDSLGTPGSAVATDKVIYQGNSGVARIVRAYYGLATGEPGTPGEPITGNQVAGTYTGTVTITLVLQ